MSSLARQVDAVYSLYYSEHWKAHRDNDVGGHLKELKEAFNLPDDGVYERSETYKRLNGVKESQDNSIMAGIR